MSRLKSAIQELGRSAVRPYTSDRPGEPLPVWLSAIVIVSLSGLCYGLLYLLIHWLATR